MRGEKVKDSNILKAIDKIHGITSDMCVDINELPKKQ